MIDQGIPNLLSPEALANPYPIYARLREEAPVVQIIDPERNIPVWLLTRYEDCIALLKDTRFTKSARTLMTEVEKQRPPEPADMLSKNMLLLDPPDHTRLRSLVHKAFTPSIIRSLQPRIQEIADTLIDSWQGQDQIDLIEDYALPLPITVIAELLGVPMEDQEKFREWSNIIVFEGLKGQDPDRVAAAALQFVMYFHNMFDERREEARDDLISGLVRVEEAGEMLSPEELISMVFLLLVAGHETTVNLIANGTLALMQHPDQMQKLKDNPQLIDSAVEEMLRYNGPVGISTMRWAVQDMEIGGQQIRRGDQVAACLLAADRDPAVFENPDLFDITRNPNKHIAFGHGIHFCLGAPLARLEGVIAINTLLRRASNLRLAVPENEIVWNQSLLLHSMKGLPVKV